MILWLDAHLPPSLAVWIAGNFGVEARAIRDLNLLHAKDAAIFQAARNALAVVMTKDADFVELVDRLGPPPKIIWIRCGNTSVSRLQDVLTKCLPTAVSQLQAGEPVVEIADRPAHAE